MDETKTTVIVVVVYFFDGLLIDGNRNQAVEIAQMVQEVILFVMVGEMVLRYRVSWE